MNSYFFENALLPEGWSKQVRITVQQGKIVSVKKNSMKEDQDINHACVIPALPNCHSHIFQRAMAGSAEYRLAQQDNFWSWRERMYQLAAHVGVDEIYEIAYAGYKSMRLSGYASVCEFHYLHQNMSNKADHASMSEALMCAAHDAGLLMTLLPVLYAYSGFGEQPLHANQSRFGLTVDEYLCLHDQLSVKLKADQQLGICFHSLRAVSEKQMRHVLCELGNQLPVHIHIAEQQIEVTECLAHYDMRPVEWLLNHFEVNSRWCLVHATHVNQDEISAIANTQAVVGLCPLTEANLADGIFPLQAFNQLSGRFAIGSDSHIQINPAAELRMLEYGQRLSLLERNIATNDTDHHTATFLWRNAVSAGTQVSAQDTQGFQPGAHARMIALTPTMGEMNCPATLLDQWVFSDHVTHQCLIL